jgi:hypothetical protein
MTKQETKQKYLHLVKEVNGALKLHFEDMWRSGGFEPTVYENDFRLPKIMIMSGLEEELWQYRPLNGEDKKTSKNLSRITSFNSH